MGKMITIEIPDDLYGSIQMISNKKNSNELNKLINHILKSFIDEEKKRMNDPIFSSIVDQGSGAADVSQEHDKYIYGI
jgi:metal-responsive CopG/Arc/MetJ family transcriptional regulator